MNMNYLRRKKSKHVKDCSAINQVNLGHWDTVWYYLEEIYRTKNGRLGGRELFFLFKCNSNECDAELLVNENEVLNHLPKI